MQEQKESPAWGGARSGAGRKKSAVKKVMFGATAEAVAVLDQVEGSRSKFINEAVVAYGRRVFGEPVADE